MSAAPVSRVSVVVEYADGQVTRMSCDQPAHAELDVNYSPYGFPYTVVGPPELRLELRPGYSPVSVETVQGAAIARVQAARYVVSAYADQFPETRERARKSACRELAVATLEAGCVMLALPAETTTAGPFGETTLEFTVPVAPAA